MFKLHRLARRQWFAWRTLFDLLMPRRCLMCGTRLTASEEHLCASCLFTLPFTAWRGQLGNEMERLFWARVPIVRANALLRYYAGSESRKPILALKYGDRPSVGRYFGRIMAEDLRGTDFFEGIDCIVSVPLSRPRQRRRGYNQSEWIARGVAEVTGIPVCSQAVERRRDNPTQTHLSSRERRENVAHLFRVVHSSQLAGRHVLLIDDVLTTGATLLSLAEEIAKLEDVRISVLVLAVARHYGKGVDIGTEKR